MIHSTSKLLPTSIQKLEYLKNTLVDVSSKKLPEYDNFQYVTSISHMPRPLPASKIPYATKPDVFQLEEFYPYCSQASNMPTNNNGEVNYKIQLKKSLFAIVHTIDDLIF